MVFENEINIYNPNAIKSEFHSQATQIGAVQGKIRAIISDSQITELQDGSVTMYDRLISAEMDINGITTQVSSLRQADDQLESQISTIRQTASSISAEVTSVKNNYARKAQIIMAINNITQESETQIKADCISLAGKTINLTSDNITINSTHFKVDKNGRITATAGTFSGQLQAATGTFAGSLSAATGTFKGSLSAATGTFAGSLSAATGTFKGSLSAATGSFSGSITAREGIIGGFTIGEDYLESSTNSSFVLMRSGNQTQYNPGKLCGFTSAGMWGIVQLYGGSIWFFDTNNEYDARENECEIAMFQAVSNELQLWLYRNRNKAIYTFSDEGATIFEYYSTDNALTFRKDVRCWSNFSVTGTKQRIVSTEDYGNRSLYCYETPTPLFGDVGEGVIGDDGKCYIQIDSIFAETVTLNQYQVFLQKYGPGEAYISERGTAYFVVEGTPGLHFGWEMKAKQVDYDQLRLEKERVNLDIDVMDQYGAGLSSHINELKNGYKEVSAA